MKEDGTILEQQCTDRSGTHLYAVKLLCDMGKAGPQFNGNLATLARKIGEIYGTASKFDILFTDYSRGNAELFVMQFLNPRGAWLEVIRQKTNEQIGVLYLSEIIPFWDAYAHISFWDSILPGREKVILRTAQWAMNRYSLPRISAEVPVYQKHFNRAVKRMGFVPEGVRREAVLRKGERLDLNMYGMLKRELEDILMEDNDGT